MNDRNGSGSGSIAYLRQPRVAAVAVCVSLGLLLPSLASADESVVSYRGTSATASDIIKSFIGGSNTAAKNQPIEKATFRGIKTDRQTRGIVFNQPTPKEQPAATGTKGQETASRKNTMQPAAKAQAAAGGCPASGTAVALEIKFAVNSAVLEPEAYRNLRQMSQAMNSDELRGCRFAVEGHTDASGNPGYNIKLSKLRASSVSNFLMATDVSKKRLRLTGKGSQEPLDKRNPYAPENRRVQFRIVGPSGG